MIFLFPWDAGEDWIDWQGVSHPPPIAPPNFQHFRFLFEVQLNSSRIFNTSHRGAAERGFILDWQNKILGSRLEMMNWLILLGAKALLGI